MPDINKTIGGLALLKVGYNGFPEAQKILDDAIELLKACKDHGEADNQNGIQKTGKTNQKQSKTIQKG